MCVFPRQKKILYVWTKTQVRDLPTSSSIQYSEESKNSCLGERGYRNFVQMVDDDDGNKDRKPKKYENTHVILSSHILLRDGVDRPCTAMHMQNTLRHKTTQANRILSTSPSENSRVWSFLETATVQGADS